MKKKKIEKLKEIIIEIRNVRTNMNVHPSKKADLIFVTKYYKDLIVSSEGFLKKLGFGNKVIIKEDKQGIGDDAVSILIDGLECYMPLEELVDLGEERKRLESEKQKLEAEVQRASKMLSNPGFINKAPQSKIEEEKAKLAKYQEMLNSIKERL